LEKFGFGKDFIKWVKILLKNQESCVINGGKTTKYFKLNRGTRQGDPISAYLFILVLKTVFVLIKTNQNIKGLNIFDNIFLYSAYADDTTFFLKDEKSVIEIVNTFEYFSQFSGLKINKTKCEVAGIGCKKGVKVALCGMRCVDLKNDIVKILGICFSYNEKLAHEKNFVNHIIKIQNILKVWKMRNLSLEGKVTVFKSLAISKIVHLALVTTVPTSTIDLFKIIQKEFLWDDKKPKVKHETLCNEYENGGLKNVDIFAKIVSLQCSWIKRLFDNSFHQWKIIPLTLMDKYIGKNLKFHSNMCFDTLSLHMFPKYYKEMFIRWTKFLSSPVTLPSTVVSQCIWFNKDIQVDGKSIYYPSFARKNLDFLGQFLDENGKIISWDTLKHKYNLLENRKFQWLQIIHAIPKHWKDCVLAFDGNLKNLLLQDHNLI